MRQFSQRQPPPHIRITPQEWKPGPEVGLKHDDLYARAWECEYEKPIFDAEKNIATPPNSPTIQVQADLSIEETRNTPGTAQECSGKHFPQTEELRDVTDTYPYMKLVMETCLEQWNKSPTNPRSSKCNIRHNLKPNCTDDYRYYFLSCTSLYHGSRT